MWFPTKKHSSPGYVGFRVEIVIFLRQSNISYERRCFLEKVCRVQENHTFCEKIIDSCEKHLLL